jgi:hypothetical protein
MKTFSILTPLLPLFFILCANAQTNENSAGIYTSVTDFTARHLSYGFNYSSHGSRLHLNAFTGSNKGYILQDGQKHFFNKNEIYGYRKNGKDYRIYHGTVYQVLDTCGFYLYYRYLQQTHAKETQPLNADEFFFSTQAGIEPLALTIGNLEKSFAGNDAFCFAIMEDFHSDNELMEYDRFARSYKIKYLFTHCSKFSGNAHR